MRKPFALALLALCACDAPQPAQHTGPAPIPQDVQVPYAPEDYPALFRMLDGDQDPAARIQRAREAFAQRVAAYPTCHQVENVDISTDSSTASELQVFAYCSNATHRMRFRAGELALQQPGEARPDLYCPTAGGPCEKI